MNPDIQKLFFYDPWWIVLIKCVLVVILVLSWQIINVWFERRVLGKMQQRIGPNMNGPLGLGQTLGDGLKFLLKEDFAPGMVDRALYTIAPIIAGVCAFTAWATIPFGGTGISGTGGRLGGAAANIEAFTHTQWVTVRGTLPQYPF